jgi:hypothetical protein
LIFGLICVRITRTAKRAVERRSSLDTETRVWAEPVTVTERLYDLGVKLEVFRNAVEFGMTYASECTAHDPPSLPGILTWGKTIRFLRDQLVPQGWEPDNAQNYATVVHPTHAYAIAAAGGDAHTGKADETPSTRSEKGPATKQAVALNQLAFADISESFRRIERPTPKQTWLLLYFYDKDAEQTRMELSLPSDINDDGYVTGWRERLILPPLFNTPTFRGDGETEEIDVKVERRSS